MKFRVLAVGALAMTVLAGCQTRIGQAAVVDGHRISDSQVSTYITKAGPSDAVKAAAQQQGQTLPPTRLEAASTLIQEQLFIAALDRSGAVPSQAQLDQLHDETAQRFFQATTTGDQFDAQLAKQAEAYGFTESFAQLVLRSSELEDAYANRIKAKSTADVISSLSKLHIPISVSGRYGKWEMNSLSLSADAGAGLPSFVKFGPGATADANQ